MKAAAVNSLAEQLEEMALSLRWSERGCLLIAAASDRALESAIVRALKERIEHEVAVTEFAYSSQRLSLSQVLRALPPPRARAALFVTDLDNLAPEDRETAIRSLNWGRERLAWAGYSVVLWVRPPTVGELMFQAHDFFSWRSGVYEFVLPRDEVARAEALSAVRLFAPGDYEALRRRYLDHLVASYQWLDFRGLLQVRNIVRLKLDEVYVP
ncbi:MAG: hypothetical protein ACE5NP_11930, partial [Anaerolineae bacterium]